MKLHFVYAGMPNNVNPSAPWTITRHLYDTFVARGFDPDNIRYYDWCHTGHIDAVGPDDIVIGHPNYDPATPIRRMFEANCRAKILIFPFHHKLEYVNWPFDDLVRKCDAYLAVTGQYWYDTIGSTRFAHWKDKIVRLDMAIDAARFPHVKKKFQPPGQRAFAYMGSDIPEKNLAFLHEMFARVPYRLHIYGMVDSHIPLCRLKNINLYGWASTVPEWATDLAAKADCFLSTSISDANPTTLLEAGCWGFQVACSPQSGYWPDQRSYNLFHGLNLEDVEGCVNFLHWLQSAPEGELLARSAATRETIVNKFNWDVFCGKVWDVVKKYV